jgi:hypothetical protein
LAHGGPGEGGNDGVEYLGHSCVHAFASFLALLARVKSLVMVDGVVYGASAKDLAYIQVEVDLEQVNDAELIQFEDTWLLKCIMLTT